MSKIHLKNVNLSYPIFGASTRSFKRSLVNVATGGTLRKSEHSPVMVDALKDITFNLEEGDKLGLVGHNGAGKSTLLRVLANIFEPQTGQVYVNGKVSALLDINVGMEPELTGYENIKIRGFILGISKEEIEKTIPDIEEFTELGNFLSMPVKTYSTGMMVRLGFGISTATVPDILLVDEVIGAGDSKFIKKAQQRMESFVARSNIFVLASHSNDVIKKFCNKAMWLEHGEIKAFGSTKDVLAQYSASVA